MKNKNILTVFSFTQRMTMASKGWKNTTVAISLMLLIVPVIIFAIIGATSSSEPIFSGTIDSVYVLDTTETPIEYGFLKNIDPSLREINYSTILSAEPSSTLLEKDGAVLLDISEKDGEYSIKLITSDSTTVSEDDLSYFEDFISANFETVLFFKSGLSETELAVLMMPVGVSTYQNSTDVETTSDNAEDESTREIFGIIIPYITVMFMYFFVLFYGQSTSQTVIIEKTSKLMDTILVSVKPSHMILGKVFACICCAVVQIVIWIVSLILGLLAGTYVLKLIDPSTAITLDFIFESLSALDGVFEPSAVILSVLIIISGCVLYCSLASVGGALAGKQEDLQSTNILFTMALVISFFIVIFGGGGYMTSGTMNTAAWLDFIPFTSVLITPAKVLIGETSILLGIVSLLITVIFSVLIMIASGKIYKMMSFYKGNVKKLGEIMKMLRIKS